MKFARYLLALADQLDKSGFHIEADKLDSLINKMSEVLNEDKSMHGYVSCRLDELYADLAHWDRERVSEAILLAVKNGSK